MNLQLLVYQYILKWSKNENMFYQKRNKTKQKDQKEKKVSKGESETPNHWRLKWTRYLMCHDN